MAKKKTKKDAALAELIAAAQLLGSGHHNHLK